MQCVVTLVHGTFAKNAAWMREDSEFCTLLARKFPDSLRTIPFQWSGSNSLRARKLAAEQLRQHLVELLNLYPGWVHLVVGHSHGGSVALESVYGSELRNQIQAVICLSTPFLHIRPRQLNNVSGDVWTMASITLVSALPMAIAIVLSSLGWFSQLSEPGSIALALATMSVVWISLWFVYTRWKNMSGRTFGSTTGVPRGVTKLFILRGVADEASAVLMAGQFSAWIMRRFAARSFRLGTTPMYKSWYNNYFGWVERIITRVKEHPYIISAAAIFGLLVTFFTIIRKVSNLPIPEAIAESVLYILISLPVLYILLLIPLIPMVFYCMVLGLMYFIWPIMLLLSVLALLPFGWDAALNTIWYEISAETAPAGIESSAVVTLASGSEDAGVLRHSAIYKNPATIDQIAKWMVLIASSGNSG